MDAEAINRLSSSISRLSRRLNVTATNEELTPAQASILSVIVSQGPSGLARLQQFERVNPTMLSRVVGKLVERELIERYPDPDDLRTVIVTATQQGRARHHRIRDERSRVVGGCVGRLDPEQQHALEAALPALEALAGELAQSTDG